MRNTGQAISRGERLPVCCPYCGNAARLVDARVLFPYNGERQAAGERFWHCLPCKAWVPARDDGMPMGTLADAGLRGLREAARSMIYDLASRKSARTGERLGACMQAALLWLGREVKAHDDGRFGVMSADIDECRAAIALMEKFVRRPL